MNGGIEGRDVNRHSDVTWLYDLEHIKTHEAVISCGDEAPFLTSQNCDVQTS